MSDAPDDETCLSHRNPPMPYLQPQHTLPARAQALKDLEDKDGHSARYHRHMRKRTCSVDLIAHFQSQTRA